MTAKAAHLVLVGGGHAHVHVLRALGERPEPGLRLTLVTDVPGTPYSGMLPGLIAGHYDAHEVHVPLAPLARFARARLVNAAATGLDAAKRTLRLADGRSLAFDLLSLDIGSAPRFTVPGAAAHATPVRPVSRLLDRLRAIDEAGRAGPLRVVVAGGGAGGVELLLALQHRLAATGHAHRFALVTDTPLLAGHNARVARIFRRVLAERRVEIREETRVVAVAPGRVETGDGASLPFDELVWATGPGAHPWLAGTGLRLEEGFVAVEPTFAAIGAPHVFAVGDTATVVDDPRPKAGVFAVRAGPLVEANLRRAVRGETLRPARLQRRYLALISTGDRNAVASWGPFAAQGRLIWRWKDRIDRRWMARYRVG